MKRFRKVGIYGSVYAVAFFLLVTLFLTVNVLSSSGFVIGDNVYWNKSTIDDFLGPRVIRESFLGDIAVLSTFKSGFLFPLAWGLSYFGIPITFLYPFLFYFLSIMAFYVFSGEFLSRTSYRVVVSVMYLVNPVTLYYFVSLLSAFIFVFLPLSLKFFLKSIKSIDSQEKQKFFPPANFALSALFVGLTISAHEQFLPTAAIIAVFLLLTFVIFIYRKHGLTTIFWKTAIVNSALFTGIIVLVNIPLILSLQNIAKATLSTYFVGRFSDFVGNVEYTYSTVNLQNLLRFGGDSGVGFGQSSWFDIFSYSNLFGYALFTIIIVSVFFLILHKNKSSEFTSFFRMNLVMFICAISLLLFVQYLATDRVLAERLFSLPLQTWESPSKLRVLLLLSGLTTSLLAFQKLEEYGTTMKRKFISTALLALIISSVVIYNSPWIFNSAGNTPIQQVSDNKNWGDLYDKEYSLLSDELETSYQNERGILVPYTHKSELYLPPNFRLLQLVSAVNEKMPKVAEGHSAWSKLLGLLSAKYVILGDSGVNKDEMFLFPRPTEVGDFSFLERIKTDSGFTLQDKIGDFTVLNNENALPRVYASKYYILYDNTRTLAYIFDSIDFKKLPVFIDSGDQINQFTVPQLTNEAVYEIKALCPQDNRNDVSLAVTNDGKSKSISLYKEGVSNGMDVFSTISTLRPGDIIQNSDPECSPVEEKPELLLHSESYALGNFTSFELNFTVNLLEGGEYSFLGPRVMIDVVNSTQYFLIFHSTGTVELAVIEDKEFKSSVMVQHLAYDLTKSENSINVFVEKTFDEIQVWVDAHLALTFPTEPRLSALSISSELSTSRFTNVTLSSRNIIKLYASRQFSDQTEFVVKEKSPERCILEVKNNDSDYAVIVQYLNTPLRKIETEIKSTPLKAANIFFNGWIVNPENSSSKTAVMTAAISDSSLYIGLTYTSIIVTWLLMIITILSAEKNLCLSRLFKKLKYKITNGASKA